MKTAKLSETTEGMILGIKLAGITALVGGCLIRNGSIIATGLGFLGGAYAIEFKEKLDVVYDKKVAAEGTVTAEETVEA